MLVVLDVSWRDGMGEAVVIGQDCSIGMVGSCRADMLLGMCCDSIRAGQKGYGVVLSVGILVIFVVEIKNNNHLIVRIKR